MLCPIVEAHGGKIEVESERGKRNIISHIAPYQMIVMIIKMPIPTDKVRRH
jgi:signal transduction histidine kinase